MRDWLFGLPERILYEQSPWCLRKWRAFSWFCSLPVSHFSVSVSFNFPCTAHTFFLEHCLIVATVSFTQFRRICTKFDAVPLTDPSWNDRSAILQHFVKLLSSANFHGHSTFPGIANLVLLLVFFH
jgi:hypothetical protein